MQYLGFDPTMVIGDRLFQAATGVGILHRYYVCEVF